MDEFFISSESYELAKRIFAGEELFIPEDQKVAVMNALYSMSKASWDNQKAEDKSFEGFTDQVVILANDDRKIDEIQEEAQEEVQEEAQEEIQEEFLEEQLLREQMGQQTMEMNDLEDPNNDSLFTMLNKSSHSLNNSLPMFQSNPSSMNFSNPLIDRPPQDELFNYGYYPTTEYLFKQPINRMDYNAPFVPSFNTFNDFIYQFPELSEMPIKEEKEQRN